MKRRIKKQVSTIMVWYDYPTHKGLYEHSYEDLKKLRKCINDMFFNGLISLEKLNEYEEIVINAIDKFIYKPKHFED